MTLKTLFIFSVGLMVSGCWFSNKQVPMPTNENEFPKPVQKPLKLAAPRKIKWNVVSSDSIHPGHLYPFSIDKIPYKLFNRDGFNPLPKPAKQTAFHYNELPDTVLNLEKIPNEPLKYKSILIGRIKKTTLGVPKLHAETNPAFFQYSDEQGFPGPGVISFMHSRDGLEWVATTGGLCILNGESMEILPYNYGAIFFMAEDAQGQVWISTRSNGLIVINRKAGIQKQFAEIQGPIEVRIDKNNFIWVTTFQNGVYLISPDQKTFKHLSTKFGLSSDVCARTMEDPDGRIWISSLATGIDILDIKANKIKRLGNELEPGKRQITTIEAFGDGDIYVTGFNRGIDIFNLRKETHIILDSLPGTMHNEAYDLVEGEQGRKWLATINSGVFLLNKNNDSSASIYTRQGLMPGAMISLESDDQHQISLGSLTAGLCVFPASNLIANHLSKNEGLLDDDIWSLLTDSKKRIWIGTYNGLNILTPDNKLHAFQFNSADIGTEKYDAIMQTGPDKFVLGELGYGLILIDESKHVLEKISRKEGFPSNNIRNLFQDSRGIIWIGSDDNGLIELNQENRTIRYLNQESGLSSNRVNSIQEISPGRYWIATDSGMQLLNTKDNFLTNYSVKEGLSNDIAGSIFKDSKNRYWVPTAKGLNLLDLVKETNTIFSTASGLPSFGVYTVTEHDGVIYAGTGKGLTLLRETINSQSDSGVSVWNLQTYGRSLGFNFLDFNANTFTVSPSGEFWWGIIQGVTTLNKTALKPEAFQKSIQVTGMDIMGRAQYFIDPESIDGRDTIWNEAKDSFYLKENFKDLNTDKQLGMEWDSLSSIYLPVNLSLPSDRNYLRFHFGGFLPQNEGVYKYQYILEGVDEKWSPITEQPFTDNYNNLSPGYYTFRVSTRKGLGVWSEPSEFHFRIRPPWWFSWWAEILYFLIFVWALRLWVGYRSRRLLEENARLEQKVSERTAELSNSLENLRQTQGQLIQSEKMASLGELTAGIAHEIQNPLNFVNNFSEVNTELLEEVNKALEQNEVPEAKNLLKDVEINMSKITFHGKRADAIVKGMLLHSRSSSGQKIPTDVNALADEYLRLSYHGLRAKDKSFNAQFTMDFDQNIVQVMLVQQDIGRVFLNLFNNAFYSVTEKKSQSPEDYQPTVSVATKKKKESIEIRIRDNGQGIPKKVIDKIYQPFFTTKPAGKGTGLGLSLSYDIITKEHGGKIDVVTKENEFTEFIIELPTQVVL